ncbi:hypothetical protein [Paenibacillus methanolicus]|uniref:Copper amine oxidase-like protein n=1 Tax=Paenibacillus methanolicus TaxID=582686 RepID=A0A5S5BRQ0_9BACL|nr:hypothetical protein [Paenibacillus methanolicus]TYP69861.1 hypothetical protein BCM02_113194 [Paenibacillus methanolicus]
MKVRSLLVGMTALSLCTAGLVYADPIAKSIRVVVNGTEAPSGGAKALDGLYLSVDLIRDQLRGIVGLDSKKQTVSIYTPNVHMMTKDSDSIFGEVNKGAKISFNVLAQIDSLKTDLAAFKVTLTAPDGGETLIEERKAGQKAFPEKGKEDFWINTPVISYKFADSGNYKVRFHMQPVGDTAMHVVSEKVIVSK